MASQQKPRDFLDLPYSPDVLLEPGFAIALVADPDFSEACQDGYEDYFATMVTGKTLVDRGFEDRFYTAEEVEKEVVRGVAVAYERLGERLVWCAGTTLGWLSALALAQYEEAKQGLSLLGVLVQSYQDQPEQKKGS